MIIKFQVLLILMVFLILEILIQLKWQIQIILLEMQKHVLMKLHNIKLELKLKNF